MLKNYFIIAFRHIKKHKFYSVINILGLSIGMASSILILLWVLDELSYDRFNVNYDRIYRVCTDFNAGQQMVWPFAMPPLTPILENNYPEIEKVARIERPRKLAVKYQDRQWYEDNICFADQELFEIFSFPFLRGNAEEALVNPFTVVITEAMAEKYFDEGDPIGKILKIDGNTDYAITGIVRNVPANSHFTFNMVCSYQTFYAQDKSPMENWFHIQFYTYVLFKQGVDANQFEQKLSGLIDTHMGASLNSIGAKLRLFLQPLARIHLHSEITGDIAPQSDVGYVYLFSAIAVFILILAGINFVNLATARARNRSQEVGMRKTLGAARARLIVQFLGESLFNTLLAVMLAVILVFALLPMFNNIVSKDMHIGAGELVNFIPAVLGLALTIGILAGLYPAFYLSSFQPISILNSRMPIKSKGPGFRNSLVVFQFVISIMLIIGTITIYRQIHFMKEKKLGFNKEHVVIIPAVNPLIRQKSYETIRNELSGVDGVKNVAGASLMPGTGTQKGLFFPEGFGENQPQTFDRLHVDENYIPALEINLVSGRNFSKEFLTDPTASLIINQAAAEELGWIEPLGKTFIFRRSEGSDSTTVYMKVIGVVENYHAVSMHRRIEPLVLYYDTAPINFLAVRIQGENIGRTLDELKSKWSVLSPDRPFRYIFLDDAYARLYADEERLGKITLYFSMLAIFIACLGLFGLAAFMAEQRTKEIGIRKVLGASVASIVNLLTKDYLRWIVIANIFAWPVAYYFLNTWLQAFAYRVSMQIDIFLIAATLALFISLLTVNVQSLKAAFTNPVDSIKYE